MYPLTRSTSRFRFFGGGYNPFSQLGPTLDLSFVDGATGVTDLSNPNGFTLNTDFTTPTYQIAAQYAVWVANVGLTQKNFADIVTFTRASTATYFNSAGTLTSAAVNEARFDYNPSTLAAQGLLIEESRTNSIRNNTMQGAVAGTPGTFPTNWGGTGSPINGLTRQIVGAGTENGITYVDVRYSGTTTSANFHAINPEPVGSVAALSGQTWTFSQYVSLAAGSTTNINTFEQGINEYSSAPAYLTGSATLVTLTSGALSVRRQTHTRTLTNASTASVQPYFLFTYNSGVAIDITFRIGLPQLEQGAFATSVIPTTTTALTRSADVASVNTLSPWYNSVEGTLYADAALLSSSYANGVAVDVGAVGAFGTTEYINWNGSAWALSPNAAPINVTSSVTTTSTAKVAAAIKANDSVIAANGLIGVTDTSCSIASAPTTLSLGKAGWSGGANYLNGYLRRITYYPRRLSNAELQTITA